MYKIEDTTISLTRGDKATISLQCQTDNGELYTFQKGDVIKLGIYTKKGLDLPPVLEKKVIVEEASTDINICLDSEDTKIGAYANKAIEYWYEISLNDIQTLIGYDDDGEKIFMLYPEGADKE